MVAEKYSASMDDELLASVRRAADADGVTVSRWLTDAADDRLRLRGLRQLVDEWEDEHGAITPEELSDLEEKVASARRFVASGALNPS